MHSTSNGLVDAAAEAITLGASVVAALAEDLDRVRTVTKDDKSPVTVADFAVQAIVGLYLRSTGITEMVGEEDADRLRTDSLVRGEVVAAVQRVMPNANEDDVLEAIDAGCYEGGATGRFWTLDPIDGTKGFLRGGQFALALGLIEDGEVSIGIMGLPHWGLHADPSGATVNRPGSLCVAVRGEGATGRAMDADESEAIALKITPFSAETGIRTCESVESAHTRHDASAKIVEAFSSHNAVRLDSQAKYAVVASGAADAYLRLPTRPGYVERIWDHAAGALVATEAGAIVSDVHGKPLDFSLGRGLEANRGVVCAVPGAHEQVIQRIAALELF